MGLLIYINYIKVIWIFYFFFLYESSEAGVYFSLNIYLLGPPPLLRDAIGGNCL